MRSFASQQVKQQDWERSFIHLDAAPVGAPIQPEILRPVARGLLRRLQVAQHSDRIGLGTRGQQRARRLDQVTRPHQVIAAQIFVALIESPRNDRLAIMPPRKSLDSCVRKTAVDARYKSLSRGG